MVAASAPRGMKSPSGPLLPIQSSQAMCTLLDNPLMHCGPEKNMAAFCKLRMSRSPHPRTPAKTQGTRSCGAAACNTGKCDDASARFMLLPTHWPRIYSQRCRESPAQPLGVNGVIFDPSRPIPAINPC
jgi:hypothetical protein